MQNKIWMITVNHQMISYFKFYLIFAFDSIIYYCAVSLYIPLRGIEIHRRIVEANNKLHIIQDGRKIYFNLKSLI